jgi:MFS family permease
VWAAVSGLALAVGPVVGGALVGIWNWRAIFWFNLLFGVVALAAAAIVLPENADPEAHRVDVPGALLGAAALAALIFAVMTGEHAGFAAPAVLVLFCGSAVAGSAFLWWEHRAAHPLLDLRFLRIARFGTANAVAFCTYFATFAIFFTALFLDEVAGYSGFRIALTFLPMMVLMIGSSLLAGVLGSVPPERSGMAASAANTSRKIGAVTGVAILGAALVWSRHQSRIPESRSERRKARCASTS